MSWLWLVGALFLGGALLAAATAFDARRRRESERAATEVPLRGQPAVDAHVPSYVTQDEIDAMPPPEGSTDDPPGARFDVGLAHPDLAPARGYATLQGARVLVVEGEVTSMRQLLAVLGGEPLLLVANTVADEVGKTLAANGRAVGLQVLACVGGPGDLIRVAEHAGAEILTGDDLRAGYVPEHAYGRAKSVAADKRRTWIETG